MAQSGRDPTLDTETGSTAARSWTPLVLLVLSLAAGTAAGYGWSRFVAPQYRAEAHLAIAPGAASPDPASVAAALSSPEFLRAAVDGLPEAFVARLRDEAVGADAADLVADRIEIGTEPGSPLVSVALTDRDPLVAQGVPNALASAFVAERRSQAARPVETPAPPVDAVAEERRAVETAVRRAALTDAESALARFDEAAAAGRRAEIERTAERERSLSELAEASERVASAQERLAEDEARLDAVIRALSQDGSIEDAVVLAQAPTLDEAFSLWRDRRAELDALGETYLDDHPRMRDARAELSVGETTVRTELEAVRAQLVARVADEGTVVDELARAEAALDAAVPPAVEDASSERAAERAELARIVDRTRADLDAWLAEAEAEAEAQRPTPSADPVPSPSPPPPPEIFASPAPLPIEPEPGPVLAGTLAGAGLGFLAGLLPFALRSGRRRPRSVIAQPHAMPVPASGAEGVPDPRTEREADGASSASVGTTVPVAISPRVDELADAVTVSRMTRLIVLGATVPCGAEAAVGLARRLAERSGSSALVDLTRDGVAGGMMQVGEDAPGLGDHLSGERPIAEIIHPDGGGLAHFVPWGRSTAGGAASAVTERLVVFVRALEDSYGCVTILADQAQMRGLGDLLHEDAAVIVAARLDDSVLVADLGDRLADAGIRDTIVLWLDAPGGG